MAATTCDAVLAGTGLDRILVQMPAWRVVGVAGWAAYGRHADLGNGLVLYATVAIAGCALSIRVWLITRAGRGMGADFAKAVTAMLVTYALE
jgi:hypothetical protein